MMAFSYFSQILFIPLIYFKNIVQTGMVSHSLTRPVRCGHIEVTPWVKGWCSPRAALNVFKHSNIAGQYSLSTEVLT